MYFLKYYVTSILSHKIYMRNSFLYRLRSDCKCACWQQLDAEDAEQSTVRRQNEK